MFSPYLPCLHASPESDRAAQRVTTTLNDEDTPFDCSQVLADLFYRSVALSRLPNAAAAAAVRHRAHWFYIRDDDETSKSTFILLAQLFALQGGDAETTKPLLTLPIGG